MGYKNGVIGVLGEQGQGFEGAGAADYPDLQFLHLREVRQQLAQALGAENEKTPYALIFQAPEVLQQAVPEVFEFLEPAFEKRLAQPFPGLRPPAGKKVGSPAFFRVGSPDKLPVHQLFEDIVDRAQAHAAKLHQHPLALGPVAVYGVKDQEFFVIQQESRSRGALSFASRRALRAVGGLRFEVVIERGRCF